MSKVVDNDDQLRFAGTSLAKTVLEVGKDVARFKVMHHGAVDDML